MSVTMRSAKNVGYVEIHNPPVNAIGQSVRQGLLQAVLWAEKSNLTRVILSGHSRMFAAGADAREFDAAPLEPHLPDILNAIDECAMPWIAAIHGVALGGGAEIAMACRMRIMAPGARIGLPEVTLGVIPGAGGTQRLPRLVGLANALEMISFGEPLDAQAALSAGLIHAIEADPVSAAHRVSTEKLGCITPTCEVPAPKHDAAVIQAARQSIAEKSAKQIAPKRAIDVIEYGLSAPFHEAMLIERAAFLELKTGSQAKALRHIFFAERAVKAAARRRGSSADAEHHAVDAGGLIGDRILARYYEAADTVFMDGSTPWEVDEAMEAFGFVMGPYESQDLSGLDVAQKHRRRQDATGDQKRRYIPIVDRMMELGKLGRKSGAGWYRYPGGNGKVEDPIVADLAIEECHFEGRARTDYTPENIRHRLVLAMINEAADILHEGVGDSASNIDLVTVYALGFPRWRGGLMHYADTIGAHSIISDLEILAKEDPIAWKVSPALRECAANDTRLAGYLCSL